MSDDLFNILSNSNKDIDNQRLMDYLSDKLSAEEKHEVEKTLLDSELESDAVEGLESFENKKNALIFAEQLNRNLQLQLQKKKSVKEKQRLKDNPWIYITIATIIIIILIAFAVVWKFLN